ncbi:MAG: hypothetical protein FJX55_05650 [Alphaproteobacteria bacterium]|nr:hypothetical protein [Alphaproteobacteria bacterium]
MTDDSASLRPTVANLATGGRSEFEASRARIEGALGDVRGLVGGVVAIKKQAADLGTALDSVCRAVRDIDAVAKRIMLLALDATIEAARTGEQAGGFAAVAGGVKQLAKQISEATAEVDAALKALTGQAQALMGRGIAGTGDAAAAESPPR